MKRIEAMMVEEKLSKIYKLQNMNDQNHKKKVASKTLLSLDQFSAPALKSNIPDQALPHKVSFGRFEEMFLKFHSSYFLLQWLVLLLNSDEKLSIPTSPP